MSAKFKILSSVSIILLTILLIAIFVSYFNQPIKLNENDIQNFAGTNHLSGDILTSEKDNNLISKEHIIISGEISGETPNEINEADNKNLDIEKVDDKPVIITSEDTMTSKEKRQILTELDDVLMELLEVVDRVQTIDETRLTTSENEVQE